MIGATGEYGFIPIRQLSGKVELASICTVVCSMDREAAFNSTATHFQFLGATISFSGTFKQIRTTGWNLLSDSRSPRG